MGGPSSTWGMQCYAVEIGKLVSLFSLVSKIPMESADGGGGASGVIYNYKGLLANSWQDFPFSIKIKTA